LRRPLRKVMEQRLAAWTARIIRARNRIASLGRGSVLVWLTVGLFVAVFLLGLANLPPIQRPVRWPLFALSGLLGAPSILLLVAAEYDASARLVGRFDVSPSEALRVSVLSTAANLLPLPGSVIVRTGALRRLGTPLNRAIMSTATLGLSWVGTGTFLIGTLVLATSGKTFGIALCVVGTLLLGGTYLILARMVPSTGVPALFMRILVIEAAFVLVGCVRFFLVMEGLRESPSVTQAVALTMSGMVASMVGIFPGGLGIRELAAGAIGVLVDLPASVGVVAASIVRLADLLVMAPLAFLSLRRTRNDPLSAE
jgi:hypothetical protein